MIVRRWPSWIKGQILRSVLLAAIGLFGCVAFSADDGIVHYSGVQQALSPLPRAPSLDAGKVLLGQRLFQDPVLSKRGLISCSTCHNLETGGTVRTARTLGYEGKRHAFNAPTIFNVGNNYRFGWRGKFTSLVVQNEAILHDPNLMAIDWSTLVTRLNRDHKYRELFKTQYGKSPDRDDIIDALVTYQLSLVTPDSAFDRFLTGDKNSLSLIQKQGLKLFTDYGCVSCHQGSNIGGNMFQIFGVFGDPSTQTLVTPEEFERRLQRFDQDENVFRVPSLRNVEVTAPYFHDGSATTLGEAIAIMGRSQLGRQLSEGDISALEAFLNSLTGVYDGKRLSKAVSEEPR